MTDHEPTAAGAGAEIRKHAWTGGRTIFGVVAAWALLVASAAALEHWTGRSVPTCLFKRVTGYPCVGCGSTRGVMAALRGDFIGAWLYNPLVITLLIVGPIWAFARIRKDNPRGRESRPVVPWSSSQRTVAWIVGIALFAANWAYVLWRGN